MIPAALACVYVVYLYHKLNAEASGSASKLADSSCDLTAIADRLAALELRAQRLADRASTRKPQS